MTKQIVVTFDALNGEKGCDPSASVITLHVSGVGNHEMKLGDTLAINLPAEPPASQHDVSPIDATRNKCGRFVGSEAAAPALSEPAEPRTWRLPPVPEGQCGALVVDSDNVVRCVLERGHTDAHFWKPATRP